MDALSDERYCRAFLLMSKEYVFLHAKFFFVFYTYIYAVYIGFSFFSRFISLLEQE